MSEIEKTDIAQKEDVLQDDDFYKEIETVSPLSDEAFKEFFEDGERFKEIVELILGQKIDDGIVSINGELRLMVNGKSIRMDLLRQNKDEVFDLEAQVDAKAFPFNV